MQTRSVSTGPGVEIACDESGFTGTNYVRSDTPVFAHASVHLTGEEAAEWVQQIRDRARDPSGEYKSGNLLRAADRPLLEWFLGPTGPLPGNAHVHLIDKRFFVLQRVTSLLLGTHSSPLLAGLSPDPHLTGLAVDLHRNGPSSFGDGRWQAFLDAANILLRGRAPRNGTAPVEGFFGAVDDLCAAAADGPASEVLRMFQRVEPDETGSRAGLLADPKEVPATDPFVPALLRAVVHWSERVGPVIIVHDEQSALTHRRIAQLQEILLDHRQVDPQASDPTAPPAVPMSGLRGADSRTDPRVQVADLFAGLARRIASDALASQGDPVLTALLRPYVDLASIWQDDVSWSALRPALSSNEPAPG